MDDIIKSYLESSDAFCRLAGDEGIIDIHQSEVHPKLIDIFSIKGAGRPFDADDLKSIGAVFMNLADKLKESSK